MTAFFSAILSFQKNFKGKAATRKWLHIPHEVWRYFFWEKCPPSSRRGGRFECRGEVGGRSVVSLKKERRFKIKFKFKFKSKRKFGLGLDLPYARCCNSFGAVSFEKGF
ncbi:MAG: hypothetical protein D6714_15220 [Bacteroidetes bacterium]|nr:MAG: hypothetical protein D6714_15220 [Bacteroidota bacterium]